jgi:tRNA(Ile)-lysidine synthase
VPFYSQKLDATLYSIGNKVSIQVAARELRYAYFEELLSAEKYARILTAHHADDNAETMLMNFLKGTGIEGLRGIQPKRGNICRPMLFATKEDINEYARVHLLSFREDSSNLTDKYTRNVIRHEVFPALKKAYPSFMENLRSNVSRFNEVAFIYNNATAKKIAKLVVVEKDEIKVPVLAILNSGFATSILHELLKEYNFTPSQLHDARMLLKAETGRHIESSSHRLLRNRNWLIISPLSVAEQSVVVIEKHEAEVKFGGGTLHFKQLKNHQISEDGFIADINADLLEYPLLLRKSKRGDYFYPLGMKHKKKLSRFYIDQKLSIFEKEKVWVLESNKKIVWVLGMRLDDRFKVQANTKNIIRLKLMPK